MKKVRNILMAEMWVSVAVLLLTVFLYETEILLPGAFAGMETEEFKVVTTMELLTICMVPLSLRLFKIRKISERLVARPAQNLLKWGSLRLLMLCVPMLINIFLYYSFMNVAFGYMCIICAICLTFVSPTMSRCLAETKSEM